jgi:hypothetical protein
MHKARRKQPLWIREFVARCSFCFVSKGSERNFVEKKLCIRQHGSLAKHSACTHSTLPSSLSVPLRDDAKLPDCGSPTVSSTYWLFKKYESSVFILGIIPWFSCNEWDLHVTNLVRISAWWRLFQPMFFFVIFHLSPIRMLGNYAHFNMRPDLLPPS